MVSCWLATVHLPKMPETKRQPALNFRHQSRFLTRETAIAAAPGRFGSFVSAESEHLLDIANLGRHYRVEYLWKSGAGENW
jgi:hypothetical protein